MTTHLPAWGARHVGPTRRSCAALEPHPSLDRPLVALPIVADLGLMASSSVLEIPPGLRWHFDNSYARLPGRFAVRTAPVPVRSPRLVALNHRLADSLGLDAGWLASPQGVAVLAGNAVPEGAEPIALAYAGHQFGGFVPQLGDGRAVLLGEVVGRDGTRRDVQLKGSGPTPFSRRGDGRAALGPVLREYLLSEAMAALGVPTTRALAAVTTGETVLRETELPGAVLTRVAASHLRIGTFQYFAARQDGDGLRILADYAIGRHYPEAAASDLPYRALLDGVVARQASLVASWMLIGFIHGVMNTDNMSISGETIDYGPCAFMDAYDQSTVFSAIDTGGRYASGNQPQITLWNLARLAEALLPLLGDDEEIALGAAREALASFRPAYEAAFGTGLRRKLGLATEHDRDAALADELLALMAANTADFTLTFRGLCDAALGPAHEAGLRSLFADASGIETWLSRWRERLALDDVSYETRAAIMRAANPAFIPRNHLVETALASAIGRGDLEPFERLLAVVTRPYDNRPDLAEYGLPAGEHERVRRTFCGT